MANTDGNPFARFAYSPLISSGNNDTLDNESGTRLAVFSGKNMQAFINHQKVGNLESVTWTISSEVVGNYVMGRGDAVAYTKGKRVIVGSMVFSQYDRHAILEQVFQLTKRNIRSVGDMWQFDGTALNAAAVLRKNAATLKQTTITGVGTNPVYTEGSSSPGYYATQSGQDYGLRGIDSQTLWSRLQEEAQYTAEAAGRRKFEYSDQLPPFDMTLVGVNDAQYAARCAIFGITITQETAGFSSNDLGNAVGISFTALRVSPWRPIDFDGASVSTVPID